MEEGEKPSSAMGTRERREIETLILAKVGEISASIDRESDIQVITITWMAKRGRRKTISNKEEVAEDYCFVCKDGGALRICDFKNCLKAYHPYCVQKDAAFLETDEQWTCGWHSCHFCQKGSTYQCYCCPRSFCRGCMKDAEFIQVKKRTKGFCTYCLKLAILAEENANADSDGKEVDFQDRETYEFLFKEYWAIVNEQEKLTLVDLHAANAVRKRGEFCLNGSDSEKLVEDDVFSDADDLEENGDIGMSPFKGRMKTPIKQSKTKAKSFTGWGSEELIGFLTSIGKDTKEPISKLDISDIVKGYAISNNLFASDGKKKKTVICDDKLYSLFRKKKVKLYKIYTLLESHLAEEDELFFSSEENDYSTISRKQLKCTDSRVKSVQKQNLTKNLEPPKSEHAALVEENIKLVYLRKSLISKLLKTPETFEDKVVGCFVRVKNDPKDFYYLPQKPYQLGQVKGIKKVEEEYRIDQTNTTNVVLCIYNIWKDVRISLLSDDDIEEDECEDLRQMVKKGLLKRLTIAQLERKIQRVHEDIMNHWIDREIGRLQRLIVRANEKGWRGEMFDYIEQRERLCTPDERIRLLKEIPSVIADNDQILDGAKTVPPNLCCEDQGKGNKSVKTAMKEVEGKGGKSVTTATEEVEGNGAKLIEIAAEEETRGVIGSSSTGRNGVGLECTDQKSAEGNGIGSNTKLIKFNGDEACPSDKINSGFTPIDPIVLDLDDDDDEQDGRDTAGVGAADGNDQDGRGTAGVGAADGGGDDDVDQGGRDTAGVGAVDGDDMSHSLGRNLSKEEVISSVGAVDGDDMSHSLGRNLSKEEAIFRDANKKTEEAGTRFGFEWHYLDPRGIEHGPYPLYALRDWSLMGYFSPDFKVWRTGQSKEDAVLLTDAFSLWL